MNRNVEAVHPSDGDLVRYLDGELGELAEHRFQGHLADCDDCRARAEAVALQASTVASYVGGIAAPAADEVTRARALAATRRAHAERAERLRGRRIRFAAAVAGVAMIGALAADPVRAWITDRMAPAASAPATPTAATLPGEEVANRTSTVAFEPRGARFDLDVEHFQAAGSLTVEVRDVDRATAQVVSAGAETVMVLPAGLRVENTATSRASYRVVVPASVSQLRVRAAGRLLATIRVDHPSALPTHTFSLVASESQP